MAFFVIPAYSLTWILEWEGPHIRSLSLTRFSNSDEAGVKLFED